jgi:2,4-dienoyl-CoA reductase-like NADH-dependent reductase (Old Yellow Enzyme family)
VRRPLRASDVPAFPLLFSPLRVGPLRLRNRVVSTAHLTGFAKGGLPTSRHVDYYGEKARGGVALVVLESLPVHPTGNAFARAIRPYDRRALPGLRRIAEAVHEGGAAVVAQLWHCGRQGSSRTTGRPLWAPSALACPVNGELPREMSRDDIREVVDAFAAVAQTLLSAGFDGVELAAAHGYLVHEFLSPLSNRRTDEYGGSDADRARFLDETLDAVRARCGRGLALGVRLSADEFLPGGLGLDDTVRLVRRLARQGGVDYVSVSAGTHASVEQMVGDWSVPRGNLVPLADAVRRAAEGIPVVACGRIVEPGQAEEILQRGQADLVGLARALIADADWAMKACAGRPRSIRPCIACNNCEARLFHGLPIACAVNPDLADGHLPAQPATAPANVVVAGGGPAGMEAARTAALRGHRVVLLEQAPALGGQLRLVRQLGTRAEFARIVAFLERELARLRVDVRLGCRADTDSISSLAPDAVVVATGSFAPRARHEGGSPRIMTPEQLPGELSRLGRRVVVSDGGAGHDRLLAVAEAALADKREVIVVTPAPALGAGLSFISLAGIERRLRARRTRLFTRAVVRRIGPRRVDVEEFARGRLSSLQDVDSVVMVEPNRPEATLRNELDGQIPLLLSAGDCVAPRGLEQAIREGRAAGLAV